MKPEEFKLKLKELEDMFNADKTALRREYAYSNQSHHKGDIISDSTCTIKIDNVAFGNFFRDNLPECVYYGYELKKDLTPRKDGSKNTIWQSSIKKTTKQ